MSPQEEFPLEGIVCVRTDRFIPGTKGIQGHEVTINTCIDQSVNQKRNEGPTLTTPWVKDSNLGS